MEVSVTGKSRPLNQAALIRPTNGRWTQQVLQAQGTTGQQRIKRASVSKLVDLTNLTYCMPVKICYFSKVEV